MLIFPFHLSITLIISNIDHNPLILYLILFLIINSKSKNYFYLLLLILSIYIQIINFQDPVLISCFLLELLLIFKLVRLFEYCFNGLVIQHLLLLRANCHFNLSI